MVMRPSPDDPLFQALQAMRAGWPARGWSWDNRLMCITSSFPMEFIDQARAATTKALPGEWSSATLPKAPPALREVAERSGGLRPGQMLYGSTLPGRHLVFGLWWPWIDGHTISMRVGLVGVDPNRDPYPRFRDLFNVSL